eukprot:IDg2889t1
MPFAKIPIPSEYVNFLNFVIFDVLLISLVFFFTTDVSGRLNHLSSWTALESLSLSSCLSYRRWPLLNKQAPCWPNAWRSRLGHHAYFCNHFHHRRQINTKYTIPTRNCACTGPDPENMTGARLMQQLTFRKAVRFQARATYITEDCAKTEPVRRSRLIQDQIRIQAKPQLIDVTLKCEKKLLKEYPRM